MAPDRQTGRQRGMKHGKGKKTPTAIEGGDRDGDMSKQHAGQKQVSPKKFGRLRMKMKVKRDYWTCVFCNKKSPYKCKLIDHMNTHTDERPHFCTECDSSFKTSDALKQHFYAMHDKSCVNCEVCGKSFRHRGYLHKHKLIHERKELYQCLICLKVMNWKHTLRVHLGAIHKINSKIEGLNWQDRFLRVVENDPNSNVTVDQLKKGKAKKPGKTRKKNLAERVKYLTCVFCDKKCASELKLVHHMYIHTDEKPYFCPKNCGATFRTRQYLKEHCIAVHESGIKCDVCGKSFRYRGSLRKHKFIHLRQENAPPKPENVKKKRQSKVRSLFRSFDCVFCKQPLLHLRDFKEHLRMHTNGRPFFCTKCDATFKRHDVLKDHFKAIHDPNSAGFDCEVCGKSFRYSKSLRNHKRTHGKKEMYQCVICSTMFGWKSAVKRHLQRIHNIDTTSEGLDWEEKFSVVQQVPNVATNINDNDGQEKKKQKECWPGESFWDRRCVFCDKDFKCTWPFVQHMLMHTGETPYFCKACNGTFKSPIGLDIHFRTQHAPPGENSNFTCESCGKMFEHQRYLEKHRLLHAEEKYECSICKKRFREMASVFSHLLAFHKNKNNETV